jgi:hypothetical protein
MSAERSPRAASSDTASARVGQRADSTVHLVETSKGRKLEDAGRERRAVTALAIGNIGKRRDAATGGHGGDGHATGGCCDARQKPRSHDTSRIAWAKLPLRVIHVIRNPFDNIATLKRHDRVPLASAVQRYFALVATVAATRGQLVPGELLELRHEDFIARPTDHLRGLCDFLGVEPTDDYVADSAAIVSRSPHQSRRAIEWPPGIRVEVERRIAEVPFLAGYSFEA